MDSFFGIFNLFLECCSWYYYATENPQLIHEKPPYDPKVIFWCGISAKCVIGPYFFEDGLSKPVTINGGRYRAMIPDFFMPILRMKRMHGSKVASPCHTADDTINLLKSFFSVRLISQKCDYDSPPHSPDLTPLDFYLWGYLKLKSVHQQATNSGSTWDQHETRNSG